jgi:hypothetical protein
VASCDPYPAEVADTAALLASERTGAITARSSYVTGGILPSQMAPFHDNSATKEGGVMTRVAPGDVRSWRLGARTRKGVLVLHIVSAGAWIGIDVVMAVVVFTALLTDDDGLKALCFRALELFAVWPLFTTGLVCLASGVVLGLGTKWGLIRYWWVAVKLALNIVLTALVLVALRPGVVEAAEQGQRFMAGESVSLAVGDLIFPPIVSPTALLIAFVLAVFKPWGRIRKLQRGRRP